MNRTCNSCGAETDSNRFTLCRTCIAAIHDDDYDGVFGGQGRTPDSVREDSSLLIVYCFVAFVVALTVLVVWAIGGAK